MMTVLQWCQARFLDATVTGMCNADFILYNAKSLKVDPMLICKSQF